MTKRIGIVDTGVNPWHSHVRGRVDGCRIFVDDGGRIREDGDFRDAVGHGTAVAGLVREGLPDAELFAIRVFDGAGTTWPSLVARAILRAAAEGCDAVNLSLSVDRGPGAAVLAEACQAAREAGCLLVASDPAAARGALPASLPGVVSAVADDQLAFGDVRQIAPGRFAAPGRPRDLRGIPRAGNLWGASFACARVTVHLVRRATDVSGCRAS
ncbi:MAG TPA: S8/S53 family peptidase [Anaeromyxobacteraceae bacterium]|nr:S8/S53 family peptidase [Anaeromyxobacteraceae bacterium]